MNILDTTLSNGLRVCIAPDGTAPVVSIQLWVNVGSADETVREAGLAHVHEHMIFKGTPTRAVGKIAGAIESAGGDINAFTSFDQTCYYVTVASRYFNSGLSVLADAIQNAVFDSGELAKELQVILEELSRSNDSPGHKLSEAVFSKAFQTHPYGKPIIGNVKTLNGLKRADVVRFFKRHYRPSNIILVIAGDVDENKALKQVKKQLGDFKAPAYRRPPRQQEPPQKSFRSALLFDQVNEAICSLLFHGPSIISSDAAPIDILLTILGSGESSRLHRRLWERDRSAFQTWAHAYLPQDPGMLSVGFSTEPARFKRAFTAICDETFKLRAIAPAPSEIAKAKRMIEAGLLYEMETFDGRARKLGYAVAISGRLDFEADYLEQMAAVTPEDLLRVARTYLKPSNMTAGAIAPKDAKSLIHVSDLKSWASKSFEQSEKTAVKSGRAKPYKVGSARIQAVAKISRPIKRTLSNGVRLVIAPNPAVPVFAFRVATFGGTRLETQRGLSHFCANMLTRGTRTKSAGRIAAIIDGKAGQISGFSGQNSLGLYGEFLSSDQTDAYDLIAEFLLEPKFPKAQAEKVRQEILFDLARREDRLARRAFDLFAETLFKRHPYRYPGLGTPESVSAITPNQLSAFWKRSLTADNLVIGLAGDVDPKLAIEVFEKSLGHLGKKRPFKQPAPEDAPQSPRFAELLKDKEQAHVVLGYLGAHAGQKERHAIEVMMSVMSGQGGRLFLELRDRMHLAYAVSGFHNEGIDRGSLGFYIATGQDNLSVAIDALRHQVDKLRTRGVTQAELDRAKRYLIGSFEIDLQSAGAVAQQIALSELYGLGYRSHERYAERLRLVTRDSVLSTARKYLNPEAEVLAVLRKP
jgi:zinc protease